MSSFTTAKPAAGVSSATEVRVAALAAILLGACMIFFIGFSHIGVVHNAAHDTRHSSAFPCH